MESIRFTKKYEYDGNMDLEVLELCNTMNALPGIETKDSCCGHGAAALMVFFQVTSEEGLFFLTRCVDRRYWKYGYLWGIDLSVGDFWKEGEPRPITYRLHSGPIVGKDAYVQAKMLIMNMNDHLNIKKFIKGYNLDLNNFDL